MFSVEKNVEKCFILQNCWQWQEADDVTLKRPNVTGRQFLLEERTSEEKNVNFEKWSFEDFVDVVAIVVVVDDVVDVYVVEVVKIIAVVVVVDGVVNVNVVEAVDIIAIVVVIIVVVLLSLRLWKKHVGVNF